MPQSNGLLRAHSPATCWMVTIVIFVVLELSCSDLQWEAFIKVSMHIWSCVFVLGGTGWLFWNAGVAVDCELHEHTVVWTKFTRDECRHTYSWIWPGRQCAGPTVTHCAVRFRTGKVVIHRSVAPPRSGESMPNFQIIMYCTRMRLNVNHHHRTNCALIYPEQYIAKQSFKTHTQPPLMSRHFNTGKWKIVSTQCKPL